MNACPHDEEERKKIVEGVQRAYKLGDHPPRLNAYFAFLNKPLSCKNSKEIFDGNIKYITKKGISQSYVFKGKLQKQYGQPERVYGKVSVEYSPFGINNDDSLWTEAQIYRYMNTLVLRRATPHVVTFVHEMNCGFTEASGLIPRDIWDILYSKTTTTNLFTKTGLRILLTEDLPDTLPLYQFLETASEQEKKEVYFQVLWTIAVFMEVGFEHHDMQFANILVTKLPTVSETTYIISSIKFNLKTRYFVRIFDFDQSTKRETNYDSLVISNPKMCRNGLLGENRYHFAVGSHTENEKYDLFKFLGTLRKSGDWKLFSRSLPDHVKKELEKPRRESTLFNSFDNPLDEKYKKFMEHVEISILMLDMVKTGSGNGEKWYLPSFFVNHSSGQKRKAESQTPTSVKREKQ